MFGRRKVYRSPNPNLLMLLYHQKKAIVLTSSSQNHFVKSFALIADKLSSVQQPGRAMRLSSEIILCGFAA